MRLIKVFVPNLNQPTANQPQPKCILVCLEFFVIQKQKKKKRNRNELEIKLLLKSWLKQTEARKTACDTQGTAISPQTNQVRNL